MTLLAAALLGVVQGLTEFLPVSSSGHLILARAFFGWDAEQFGLTFDVACHAGTLLAVLVFFRRDLLAMAGALPRIFTPRPDPPAHLAWLIAVGTLPVVAFGLGIRPFEDALRTPAVAGATLAAGGVLLLLAERAASRTRNAQGLRTLEALGLGAAQALALIPGVSRSGATITLALFLGLRRDEAARFSFLLGVPAISAAAALEAVKLAGTPIDRDTAVLFAVGLAVSAVVGYATIKYFLRFLASHSLSGFAWYRLALAASVVVWLLGRG